MTPEEIEFENKLIHNWWESTLDGSKPCSLFSQQEVTEEYLTRAREKGLEIVRLQEPKSEGNPPIEIMYVAQPGKFRDLISKEKMQRFRALGLGDRLDTVLAEIGDTSIGQAMAYLRKYKREDEEYNLLRNLKGGGERPEIAVLTGLGLGYPPCDIEYYFRTNYLGEEHSLFEDVDPKWGYGLCPEHAQSERQHRQQQHGDH